MHTLLYEYFYKVMSDELRAMSKGKTSIYIFEILRIWMLSVSAAVEENFAIIMDRMRDRA